jgi:hypothetical protein
MSQSAVCVAEAAARYVIQPEPVAQWAFVADSSREHANEALSEITGITGFFPDQETFEAFQQAILAPGQPAGARKARQWGDFQTPLTSLPECVATWSSKAPRLVSSLRSCQLASLEKPEDVVRTFGWTGDKFVADIAGYQTVAELDGISPWVWRQGIKHDCAAVMELKESENTLVNGEGEDVTVEADWVYSLLKGSDLRGFQASQPRKKVIITQRSLEEDPASLQIEAPRLWAYLERHRTALARRKSSIYKKRPSFTILGIGDYSFKPFKVAISGLHKKAQFAIVPALDGRPVMLDDTCYFLGFDTYFDALWTASLLNSGSVLRFLESIVFTDAKRPYTKDILMRIDLLRASSMVSFREISDLWGSRGFVPPVTALESDYESYRQRLGISQTRSNTQLSFGF